MEGPDTKENFAYGRILHFAIFQSSKNDPTWTKSRMAILILVFTRTTVISSHTVLQFKTMSACLFITLLLLSPLLCHLIFNKGEIPTEVIKISQASHTPSTTIHTLCYFRLRVKPAYYHARVCIHAISLYDCGVQHCHMCIGDVCVACWRHVCVFLLWVCCQGACGSLQEISPTLRHSL